MLVNWILSRLSVDENGEVEVNFLYNSFTFECLESGKCQRAPCLQIFIDHLKVLFPNIVRVRRKVGSSSKTVYRGITLEPLDKMANNGCINFTDIADKIPSRSYQVKLCTPTKIECVVNSGYLSNGHKVEKIVTFHENGEWNLKIGETRVDFTKLFIDGTYLKDTKCLQVVLDIVEKIDLCSGVKLTKNVVISRYHTLDTWQDGENSIRSLRSIMCLKAIPFNSKVATCSICRKMTFGRSKNKENVPVDKLDQKEQPESLAQKISKLLPSANDNMVQFLTEQAKNVERHPKGRRWSQQFIGTCLQLFNRSPHCYEMLIESQLVVLPSKSLLIKYKNTLKQEPGFDPYVFQWMHMEANRQNIPPEERYGGIIFDEMSIQADLEIDKKGDIIEFTGFSDYGEEGDMFHALRMGTKDKTLGTHVLQLLFLCSNGFRFPFAHFVTQSIQASELYALFWKAVLKLYIIGFKVMYTCMDGAQSNRSFMHLCLGDNPQSFVCQNPSTPLEIIFLMDISHVIKKLRNNILKSGISAKCTRVLTLPSGCTIQWQMFVDFYHWDQQNSLQIHRKLTNEHFFMDSQLKMRNHLAEDVLNMEMLHAMKVYQNALGEKGQVLNGVIEILEFTSKVIAIFRDMRPIKSIDDVRLKQLQNVSSWFLHWQNFIAESNEIPQKDKGKKLLTSQCHEDIQSCIQGFIHLCHRVLHTSKSMSITPGLINSDVVENIFNQQRSTYHGANANPNALQYKRSINSILVGQNIVSKKSNVGKSSGGTLPFSFATKTPLTERSSTNEKTAIDSKIKVVNM